MKFQILNNEELGFFDSNGVKKATMKISGSNLIIDPIDNGGNIIMGEGETVNDLELGITSTPVNMTFLGGGTISSNGSTLHIGNGSSSDSVILSGVTISSSVNFPSGITGSFQGTHTGTFIGNGSQITGVTATQSPGGGDKTVQFNDGNTDTSGNDNFTFNKTTNVVKITGSLNVSGSSSADYFFGDGSGLTNIIGAFPFTGSAGVSGSIEVQGPVTASAFTGDGSGLTNITGVFPFTGSAGISGSLDVNGNVTANEFYGNGTNITGVTSTFAPTGQNKSLQFNKGGTEISGSDGILFDYNTDSLYVAQAITASTFTGSFVGDGSNLTIFPYTGSAVISGSLEIIGDITGSSKLELNTPNGNVIIGYQAGQNDPPNQNVFIGYQAGKNVTGAKHVAIGYQAGSNMSNIQNIAIGHLAGGNGGAYNITLGADARRNSAGQANISIGHSAFRSHGSNNNAIGIGYAVGRFGGGTGAILLGHQAGYSLSGDYNIGLGYNVGYALTGEYNTMLGYESGYYASGSKNVILGYQAGYNLTGSNQLIIANNSSSSLIQGDFDSNTLYVSGTLIAKEISGSTTDIFQVQSHTGATLFEVRPGFIQFGNLGDSLGIDFSGGNRSLKFYNTGISAQGNIPITSTGQITLSPGSGTNSKIGLFGVTSAYGNAVIAKGNSATQFNYPDAGGTELTFYRSVNHLPYYAVIRGDDNQYQPVPIYIFGGKHTTNGTLKPIILQHDTSESRGNVGIGLEDPQANLHVSGAISASAYYGDASSLTGVASFPYTGSVDISGSIQINGSGSTLFDVVGSQGQLFSITDSLTGSLFAVSDVSGLPILEVFSDDTIKMGSFNNEALEVSGSDVNFNNLPTSDPGVSGRLFKTGSDAIGATAGFQVVCISQG